jgi:endonuclease/exonuclease/phosphatase (EEP) superfamily protein YafD
MRIIFLNSWFGKVGKPFFDFIKKEKEKTDVFCLMEFNEDSVKGIFNLSDWNKFGYKGTFLEILGFHDENVIFSRKKYSIIDSGSFNTTPPVINETGIVQYIQVKFGDKNLTIANVHGISKPGEKFDTPERLGQSKKIIEHFKGMNGLKIIGGDFNLMPDTKSVKMFEKAGYKNLIKDFDIKNTRNELSWKQFNNYQYFADYVFVSPEVKVKSFEVPYMEISDHLPQILEFEI